ncbi:MAG: hypothetical protein RLY31_25 [Bacteroidota bacterium]
MNLINFFPTTTRKSCTTHPADRLFQDFFQDSFPVSFPAERSANPAVNIAETEDQYRIEVAAPGLQKGDFEVKVEKDILSIIAKKETEKANENRRYTRREFGFHTFRRNFHLPEQVDTNAIQASYEQGILVVTLEKKPEAKPLPARTIAIN